METIKPNFCANNTPLLIRKWLLAQKPGYSGRMLKRLFAYRLVVVSISSWFCYGFTH